MEQILHRDVKPANMLIKLIDRDVRIKLCDFGVCCSSLNPGIVKGTTKYLPPRYKQGAIQNDMWALGVSLLEIISGNHPFVDWNPNEIHFKIQQWKPTIPEIISDQMQELVSHL